MTEPAPLADRVVLALTAAGLAPVTAVNFDQVTKAGWKVHVADSGATYVYAELPPVSADDQAALASAKSAGAWLGVAASVGHVRQMEIDDLLTAYATALRAEGFPVELLDLGDRRARLRVEPLPPCGQCGHTEHRHRDGHCTVCGILRMNDPNHAYTSPQGD
jgi:hypothetical protein